MRPDFLCEDCSVDTHQIDEYYMVTHELWQRAAGQSFQVLMGVLCIGCLEQRIGRKLAPSDFISCPANRAPNRARSQRLKDRLGL